MNVAGGRVKLRGEGNTIKIAPRAAGLSMVARSSFAPLRLALRVGQTNAAARGPNRLNPPAPGGGGGN
jgi:hypothetical protein